MYSIIAPYIHKLIIQNLEIFFSNLITEGNHINILFFEHFISEKLSKTNARVIHSWLSDFTIVNVRHILFLKKITYAGFRNLERKFQFKIISYS